MSVLDISTFEVDHPGAPDLLRLNVVQNMSRDLVQH